MSDTSDNLDYNTALMKQSWFAVLQAKIFIDGNQWCALYGDNIQAGVAGFGNSPYEATVAFDRAWCTSL